MPLHFESFVPNKKEELNKKLLSDILTKYVESPDNVVASQDKRKILATSYLKDVNTKNDVGKVVTTLIVKEKNIEIVDSDIVLLSDNKVKLHFEIKLKESSESNEYYIVKDLVNQFQFDIETVNRYCINGELENKDHEAYLSAFPFKLNIYKNEKEMNKDLGFGEKIDVPALGKKVII